MLFFAKENNSYMSNLRRALRAVKVKGRSKTQRWNVWLQDRSNLILANTHIIAITAVLCVLFLISSSPISPAVYLLILAHLCNNSVTSTTRVSPVFYLSPWLCKTSHLKQLYFERVPPTVFMCLHFYKTGSKANVPWENRTSVPNTLSPSLQESFRFWSKWCSW